MVIFPTDRKSGNIDGKLERKGKEGENLLLPSGKFISLELIPCRKCGTAFATLKEIEKVRKAISGKVPLFSGGDLWMEFCPECRKAIFREKEAEILLRTRQF